MTNNPISSNQVIDVPVTLNCLTPSCKTLNAVIQAVDTEVCNLKSSTDVSGLAFGGCVAPADSVADVLQSIINALPCSTTVPGNPTFDADVANAVLTGLLACSSDHWNCAAQDGCIDLTNQCDPGVVTVQLAIQALINRVVALGTTIKSQCDRIDDLETNIATMQLQITQLQTCCN